MLIVVRSPDSSEQVDALICALKTQTVGKEVVVISSPIGNVSPVQEVSVEIGGELLLNAAAGDHQDEGGRPSELLEAVLSRDLPKAVVIVFTSNTCARGLIAIYGDKVFGKVPRMFDLRSGQAVLISRGRPLRLGC